MSIFSSAISNWSGTCFVILILSMTFTFSACDLMGTDDDDDIPTFSVLNPASVSQLQSSDFEVTAGSPANDQLLTATVDTAGNTAEVVFQPNAGSAITVLLDSDGFPSQAVVDDHVILLGYRGGETVDVAAVTPEEEVTMTQEVELPESAHAFLNNQSGAAASPAAMASGDVVDVVQVAGVVAELVLCSARNAQSNSEFEASIPTADAACEADFLQLAATMSRNEPLQDTPDGWNYSWCSGDSPEDCLSQSLANLENELESALGILAERQQPVAQGTGAVRFQGVWAYPQGGGPEVFGVTADVAFDAAYDSNQDCYDLVIGDFVGVDGDIFTYSVRGGNLREVELYFERIAQDQLYAERINPGTVDYTLTLDAEKDTGSILANRCDNSLQENAVQEDVEGMLTE